jgi:hypothetical protein
MARQCCERFENMRETAAFLVLWGRVVSTVVFVNLKFSFLEER